MKVALAAEKTILNEPVLAAPPSAARSAAGGLALVLATGGGTGFFPFAPATFGSLVGVGVFFITLEVFKHLTAAAAADGFADTAALASARIAGAAILLIGLFLIGIWSATRAAQSFGAEDPKPVVIDEIFGQIVTFLFLPDDFKWWMIAAGFFAFRLFDIWKLYPANRLESLPGGLGIMADDAAAGCYAAALLAVLHALYLLLCS